MVYFCELYPHLKVLNVFTDLYPMGTHKISIHWVSPSSLINYLRKQKKDVNSQKSGKLRLEESIVFESQLGDGFPFTRRARQDCEYNNWWSPPTSSLQQWSPVSWKTIRRGAVGEKESLQIAMQSWHQKLGGFHQHKFSVLQFWRIKSLSTEWLSSSLLRVSQDKKQGVNRSPFLSRGSGRNSRSRFIQVVSRIHFLVIAGPVSLLVVIWVSSLAPEAPLWFLSIGP